jgi:hypothetical protein
MGKKSLGKIEEFQSFVEREVDFNDGTGSVIKDLIESEDAPILTSIGYCRVPGKNDFVSYVVKTQGNKVIKITVGEPNLRAIVDDESKINYVQSFMDAEA